MMTMHPIRATIMQTLSTLATGATVTRQEATRWPQERVTLIRLALDRTWIKPGQAAGALGLHRATVHNCMADGRLSWMRLGGSRLRSVRSMDVLRLVLAEMEDCQAGCDMGACSRVLIAQVRRTIREQDERSANGDQANTMPNERRTVCQTPNRRTANSVPNGEPANGERCAERRTGERRTPSTLSNGEHSVEQANGEQANEQRVPEHHARTNGERRTANGVPNDGQDAERQAPEHRAVGSQAEGKQTP